MTKPAVVDWEYLLTLRAMRAPTESDLLLELIELFHEVSSERLASARAAIASGDAHARWNSRRIPWGGRLGS